MGIGNEFVDFVKAQPADKPIDHYGNGATRAWESCAIGEFLATHGYHYEDRYLLIGSPDLNEPQGFLTSDYPHVRDMLNRCAPKTYGELAAEF